MLSLLKSIQTVERIDYLTQIYVQFAKNVIQHKDQAFFATFFKRVSFQSFPYTFSIKPMFSRLIKNARYFFLGIIDSLEKKGG